MSPAVSPEILPETPARSPDLDFHNSFAITEKKPPVDRILVMNHRDKIRLVKLELGEGWIIFTGEAHFLHNYYLRRTENVNLAGVLFLPVYPAGQTEMSEGSPPGETASAADNAGVLFIRAIYGDGHFFGNLVERGNPWALAVSLALLIIAGFWMVIPPFGRFRPAPEKPGKPLRERFLAEGRFLKKYHALGKYLEVYERELEHRSRSKGMAVPAAAEKKAVSFIQFLKEQKNITEQLDQLNKLHRGNV
jgi:hypothetical protein